MPYHHLKINHRYVCVQIGGRHHFLEVESLAFNIWNQRFVERETHFLFDSLDPTIRTISEE